MPYQHIHYFLLVKVSTYRDVISKYKCTYIYIFKYIQLCPLIPLGPHFTNSSAVIKSFALYRLFERAVSTYITVSEVITVPDKILCMEMPQLHPSPVHQQSQHRSCKFCILFLSLSKLREQFQQTFIGLMLENETENQQYAYFFLNKTLCLQMP